MSAISDKLENTSPTILLSAVVALALFLRIIALVFVVPDTFPDWRDTAQYVSIARNLVDGKGYVNNVGYWHNEPLFSDVGPTSFWLPLYPFFLAGMFHLFGETPRAIFLVQSIVSAAAVGILFLAVLSFLGTKIAFLAALIQAIDPFDIYYANFPSTESFTASLIAGILFLGLISERHSRSPDPIPWSTWLGLTLILAIGCLHRSTFVILAFIVISYILILRFVTTSNLRDVLIKGAGAVMLMAIVISPWIIRNYMLWGKLVYESKVGINLAIGNNDKASGTFEVQHLPPLNPDHNEIERDEEYKHFAWSWISKHPFRAFALFVKKNLLLWNPVPREIKGSIYYIGLIWSVFLLSFTWIGIIGSFWNLRRFALPLLLLTGYVMSISIAFATTRFRVPLIPLIALFAAYGIYLLLSFRKIADFKKG